MTQQRGLGFRGRVALLIAAPIFCAGLVASAVLYVIVSTQFDAQVNTIRVSAGEAAPVATSMSPPTLSTPPPTSTSLEVDAASPGEIIIDESASDVAVQLRERVLTGMIPWLVASQLGLAVLAAAAGWWLSGRLLRRVFAVVGMAATVASGDLTQRLRLAGPRDEITDLGDTFDAMLDRLESSFTAQRLFVANASHELRTPLAGARIAIDAPLHQGLLDGPGRPGVEAAIDSLDKASALLDRLLELAMSREAAIEDGCEVDLAHLTQATIDHHEAEAAHKRQSVTADLGPATATGSPSLLARALDNLVGNAVRHAPAGGTITIETSTVGDEVQVLFTNDGDIMDDEGAAQLVRPFERGTQSRRSGVAGSGLGLAIVAAIVERHDGHLLLTARPGGGLNVQIRLPLAPPRTISTAPSSLKRSPD